MSKFQECMDTYVAEFKKLDVFQINERFNGQEAALWSRTLIREQVST